MPLNYRNPTTARPPAQGGRRGFCFRRTIANSLNTNQVNSSTSQIKPRYLRVLRAIGDVLTAAREIKIYIRFVSSSFSSRIPQGVFSLSSDVARINRAFIYQPGNSVAPVLFVSSVCMCMRQRYLKTAFICRSIPPRTRRLGPFASWEIGAKILDSSLD